MGWLPIWGQEDPMKDIDPSLRQFLEKQTPSKYKPEEQPSERPTSTGWRVPTFRSIFGLGETFEEPNKSTDAQEETRQQQRSAEDTVPQESLFQDGRYAHLWKNYRSTADVEEAGKSDQEKLTDIVGAFKERNAELGRAAMENCANEQMAIHECFSSGSWAARLSMCRSQNRELEKCVNMQRKFLRALGYLSVFERTTEENERIQMHADTLYQRMLKQEKAIEEAKEKGLPMPELEPLITPTPAAPSTQAPADAISNMPMTPEGQRPRSFIPVRPPVKFEALPKNLQEKYANERFKDLEGPSLELAKRELEQDLAWKAELLDRFGERYVEERRERLERQARGRERVTDKVKRIFDLRDWSKIDEMEAQRREEEAAKQKAAKT